MTKPIDILTGGEHSRSIAAGVCTGCGEDALMFRDEVSAREAGISGFCQACQDKVWPPDPTDEPDEAGDAEAFERPIAWRIHPHHPADAEAAEVVEEILNHPDVAAGIEEAAVDAALAELTQQCECDNHHGFCEVHD